MLSSVRDREFIDPLLHNHFPIQDSVSHSPNAIVEAIPRGHLGAFDTSGITHLIDDIIQEKEEYRAVFAKKEGSRVFFLCMIDNFAAFKQWIGGKDLEGAVDDLFLSVSGYWKGCSSGKKRQHLLEYVRCLIRFEILDRCARLAQAINFRLYLPEPLIKTIAFGFFHSNQEWREEYAMLVGTVILKCPPRDLLTHMKAMQFDVGVFLVWLQQLILPLSGGVRDTWFLGVFRKHVLPTGGQLRERDVLTLLFCLLHPVPLVVLRGTGVTLGSRLLQWLSNDRNLGTAKYWLTPREYIKYFILPQTDGFRRSLRASATAGGGDPGVDGYQPPPPSGAPGQSPGGETKGAQAETPKTGEAGVRHPPPGDSDSE